MLFLGEWVDEEGGVFQNWETSLLHESAIPAYDSRRKYCLGVDLAIHEDFNVVYLADASTRTVIKMWRWNKTHETITYDRIVDIWEEHGRPYTVADASGLGRPMVTELQGRGMQITGLVITSANKLNLVKTLASDMEHRRIMFPPYPALKRELNAFMYHATPSGKLTARAASGYNDDMIMGLVMVNEALRHSGSGEQTERSSWMNAKSKGVRQRMREMTHATR
jgi:hypothetical protein